MDNLLYYYYKLLSKITKNKEVLYEYYRSYGGVEIGDNCLLCSRIPMKDVGLLKIGNNVTISTGVSLVTHDNSIKYVFPDKSDLFGRITIGNNCFIGENATILYGCSICDCVIVAAGSVVTHSFTKKGIIVAGNPAKIIGTWKKFSEKYASNAINRADLQSLLVKDESFLVVREEKNE